MIFTVSEAGSVRLRVTRLSTGRRVGKRCVAATRSTRRRKPCTRRGPSTTTVTPAAPGAGQAALDTRLLRAGRYELRVEAVDAAGNASRPVTRTFAVRR